ncbi:MAG: hypothetical protein LBF12_05625 [Christensenellaceae bacterium]|nr:hypothetical protein [Christensenellaceae bacterium]
MREGRVKPAEIANHIMVFKNVGARLDLENIQSLWCAYHNTKHGEN